MISYEITSFALAKRVQKRITARGYLSLIGYAAQTPPPLIRRYTRHLLPRSGRRLGISTSFFAYSANIVFA